MLTLSVGQFDTQYGTTFYLWVFVTVCELYVWYYWCNMVAIRLGNFAI